MAKKRKRNKQGLGSVFKRADGCWVAQVHLGYNAEGKARYKTSYGKSEDEAVKALLKIQAEVSSSKVIPTERQTVGQFLDRWMENAIEGQKAPATVR